MGGPLDHRMTDKGGSQPILLEERHLEGKQRQHQVEIMRHRLRAIGAGRPDLWRDIIHGANGGIPRLDASRHPVGEVRAVDHHHHIGLCLYREIHRLAHPLQDFRNGRHDLPQAHHCGGIQRIKTGQAFARHRQTADTGETDAVTGKLF